MQIEQDGTTGTALNAPKITMQYTNQPQHYSDLFTYATPTTNCSPAHWSPQNGNNCYLWSRSYNAYYLSNLDNGRGCNETISWKEGRNKPHGVDVGHIVDHLACDGQGSTYHL